MSSNAQDLFTTIRRIQVQTARLAKTILSGSYRSAFKGQGMEFFEVREYQEGDEVRHIDWNVSARMNHPYVKTFREERSLSVMLIVDVSASSRFGSKNGLKSTLIAELGAVIAFSAIKSNDNVGLLLFTDRIELYLPPRSTTRHVLRVIRELLAFHPRGKGTDVTAALAFLGKLQIKPGVCFLISDFLASGFQHEASLVAKKHDLIALSVTDPYEIELPSVNLISLKDLETGEDILIDASDPKLRQYYQDKAENHLANLKKMLEKIGAGWVDIRTDQPYLPAIDKFFKIWGHNKHSL